MTLGGRYSVSWGGINTSGQVTGDSTTSNGHWEPYVTIGGVMTPLNPGDRGSGVDINDSGEITGWLGNQHAFVTNNGNFIDLGTLGGNTSYGYGINANGQVTGEADTADGQTHAFITINGIMIDLGTLGGSHSLGWGINSNGQISGYSTLADGSSHGFVTVGGIMTDLNSLTDSATDWVIINAGRINDSGQIAATGINAAGETHAVLLNPNPLNPNPLPVPATVWLFGAGLAGMGFMGKGRSLQKPA